MNAEHIMWLIISIIIFGGMALSVFVLRLTLPPHYKERLINLEHRYNERMALIEKGMDPALADKKQNQSSWNDPLVWGLLLTGIGVGFVTGYIIALTTGWNKSIIMHSMAFLLGGISLITYYFYKRNEIKRAA